MPRVAPLPLVLLILTATAVAQPAGTSAGRPPDPDPPAHSSPAPAAVGLPVSLDRIRRDLARADTLARATVTDWQPMFRVEVDGQLPSFSVFIGEDESLSGPAPWGGMTHAEFMAMVTPPQARAFGASTNGALLQVLASSLATAYGVQGLTALARAAPDGIRRGREAVARREVQRTLAELERRQREERARAQAAEAERRKAEEAGLLAPIPRR